METLISCAKGHESSRLAFPLCERKTCYNSPCIVAFSLGLPMLLLDSLPISLCLKQIILLLLYAKRVCLSFLVTHSYCVSENTLNYFLFCVYFALGVSTSVYIAAAHVAVIHQVSMIELHYQVGFIVNS